MQIGWTTDTESDTYLSTSIHSSTWSSLSTSQKTAYLTTAYRNLLANPEYEFPDTASQKMKDAQAEYALYLVRFPDDNRANLRTQGVRSFSIGRFSESLDAMGNTTWSGAGIPLPAIVVGLLHEYLSTPQLSVYVKRDLESIL